MNINIKTFNSWAIKNKDVAMQKGHIDAVDEMFNLINKKTNLFNKPFHFLDIGCGNGWVVRKASKLKNCKLAEGVDGAPEMIKKAILNDKKNNYYIADIENWNPIKKYDIIFSMETFYYFKNPKQIINNLKEYINKDGILIIGIDHYAENIPSLNWDEEYNISTNTFTINQWENFLIDSDLDNIIMCQYGPKKEWKGTLILLGNKKMQ